IPYSLNSLSHLLALRLENNVFTGTITQLNITSLQDFNASGNHLTGAIPGSLSKFPTSAFASNVVLCRNPLPSCKNIISNPTTPGGIVNSNPVTQDPSVVPSTPSSNPESSQNTKKSSNRLSKGDVIAIVVGDFAVLFLIACIFIWYYWRKYSRKMVDGKPLKRLEIEKIVYSSSPYQHPSSSAERGNEEIKGGARVSNFSGSLPSSISLLDRLWRLDVSNNFFTGQIPYSLNSLSHLLTLRLENNVFTGTIAQLNITSLQDFNASGNHLTGAIPGSLSKFPASAFASNVVLCGNPLPSCKNIISNPTTPGGIVNSNPVTQDPSVVPSTPSSKPESSQNTKKSSNRLSRGVCDCYCCWGLCSSIAHCLHFHL
ncbi:hypothetical protein KI387_026033, partial [Taxus chinensis]